MINNLIGNPYWENFETEFKEICLTLNFDKVILVLPNLSEEEKMRIATEVCLMTVIYRNKNSPAPKIRNSFDQEININDIIPRIELEKLKRLLIFEIYQIDSSENLRHQMDVKRLWHYFRDLYEFHKEG